MLSVALFTELGLNPGASAGLSYAVRSSPERAVVVSLFGGPKVAGYLHPQSHSRLLGQLEGGVRVTGFDIDLELLAGMGGTRMFRASPTYTFVDGALERVRFAGQWGWMPSAAVGIGGLLPGRDHLRWFVRPTVLIQAPYNSGAAPFFVAEIGVRTRGEP